MKPPSDKVARTSPVRARKNRARWCGGHVGREHEPEIRLDKTIEGMRRIDPRRFDTRCRWSLWMVTGAPVSGELHWSCGHQSICKVCGRVLEFRAQPTMCPDWVPGPDGPVAKLRCRCGDQLQDHSEGGGCTKCRCRGFDLPKASS